VTEHDVEEQDGDVGILGERGHGLDA